MINRSSSTGVMRRSTIAGGTLILRPDSGSKLVSRAPTKPSLAAPMRRRTSDVALGDYASAAPKPGSKDPPAKTTDPKAVERGSSKEKVGESLGAKALRLSKKFNMTFFEVKDILEAFGKTHTTEDGIISKQDLKTFLCQIFMTKELPEDVLEQLYKLTCLDAERKPKAFDMEELLSWQMCNFAQLAVLKGDTKAVQKSINLQEICDKFGLLPNDLDKIQRVFDKYDTDGSGQMDQSEFAEMIVSFIGAKKEDFSKDRLDKWWREIDADGSGEVDFGEFVEWYIKYFGSANSGTPTDAFYNSFNPSVQRRQHLEKQDMDDM
eukprot:TRINITY_DN63774_c0_g1_i1.p1 TRINITY_DN63774_c0_g1~~TRINITY_DN63774_c0_g1_i1.p1  ORF type:complete len:342 (+),score=77.19 TRINITY_DN63774_c0_g1_i1:64-1026(+)